MSLPQPPGAPFAVSHRMLAGALMGALVVIGVALFFVLPSDEAPPVWVPLAQVLAGVGLHLALEAVGYRTPPLDPSLDDDAAAAQATTRYQAGMILRCASPSRSPRSPSPSSCPTAGGSSTRRVPSSRSP